jgi:phenylacetate-CoA ligase
VSLPEPYPDVLQNNLRDNLRDNLKNVLQAAAIAPGNHTRFAQAGLIDRAGSLVTDWPAAFARLSPLSKEAVRSHPGHFLAQAHDVVYRGKTSGTQSDAFTYFAGAQWNQRRVEARQRSLAGWGIEDAPILNVASRLGPVRLQDSSLVGKIDAAFVEMLRQIVEDSWRAHGQPLVLRGYPSRLCEVAITLRRSQLTLHPDAVVAVIATGECLFTYQRSLLSKTFHAPVINEYGCQESGISGMSCPEAGRLHLDSDRCLYEMHQDTLLTTDLYNTTMPMVRYESGDRLRLHSEPCPCGRPGPTAQVLGRQEEAILQEGTSVWPGEIDLPDFPGLLSYQMQLSENQRRLWVQSEKLMNPAALTPLKQWMEETLGTGNTEVLIESPFDIGQAQATPLNATSSEQWLSQVTEKPWSSWIYQPLPMGEGQAIAALLRQIVAPQHIVLRGLSPQACQQVVALSNSTASQNLAIEAMKIRVLLWATSIMAEGNLQAGLAIEIKDFYTALFNRFERWAERLGTEQTFEIEDCSAIGFDLLAPLLCLEGTLAQSLWSSVTATLQRCWPKGIKADAFTMHHYLAVLEIAGAIAQQRPRPLGKTLRPLSAILIGDFYQRAATLTPRTVALWAQMIYAREEPFVQDIYPDIPETDFSSAWQSLRQELLRKDKTLVSQQLENLFKTAKSPQQIAQSWLEKGYAALAFEEPLDPTKWIEVLREQVIILGPTAKFQDMNKPQQPSNPIPWMPILKALAPELIKIEQHELAYSCLFAAAPPNRKFSNFDRQTLQVNSKQSVVSGLKPLTD